jgi:hypothetical protein
MNRLCLIKNTNMSGQNQNAGSIQPLKFNYRKMRMKLFLSVFCMGFLFSISLSAQNPDFSGEWKLNKEKSTVADNSLFVSKIIIHQKPDSLLTNRLYENNNGEEYTFDENFSLDGKDTKLTVYDLPRTSRATIGQADGTLNINSTTTFNGSEDFVAVEKWKLENEGKVLTLAFTNKMSGNEISGTYYYEKSK